VNTTHQETSRRGRGRGRSASSSWNRQCLVTSSSRETSRRGRGSIGALPIKMAVFILEGKGERERGGRTRLARAGAARIREQFASVVTRPAVTYGERQRDVRKTRVHCRPWQCLVPSKFQKFYKIPRHIESLDACMEY
jgi:hypothetical protein